MRIVHWPDLIQGNADILDIVALTIGVFDGVHIGHQKLIRAITESSLTPAVITFTSNPIQVLKPRQFGGNILTLDQKVTKLELFGIRLVILIDFSYEFSKITGREFWFSLFKRINIGKIAVGRNFYFGHNRESDAKTLQSLSPDIKVEIVKPVHYKGKIVSSTRIRQLIHKGEFEDVKEMLGIRYELDLRSIEFITLHDDMYEIDLKNSIQVIPDNGKYSAIVRTDTGDVSCKLEFQDDKIRWKKNADYNTIMNIFF